jgi:hypothetical protein
VKTTRNARCGANKRKEESGERREERERKCIKFSFCLVDDQA